MSIDEMTLLSLLGTPILPEDFVRKLASNELSKELVCDTLKIGRKTNYGRRSPFQNDVANTRQGAWCLWSIGGQGVQIKTNRVAAFPGKRSDVGVGGVRWPEGICVGCEGEILAACFETACTGEA
jgi:hypothetical protein